MDLDGKTCTMSTPTGNVALTYSLFLLEAVGLIQIGSKAEPAGFEAGKRRSCFLKHDDHSSSFSHIFAESSSRLCMSDRPFSSSLVLA